MKFFIINRIILITSVNVAESTFSDHLNTKIYLKIKILKNVL